MTAQPESGLVIRGLSKAFGGPRALDDVSLTARGGQILALLGQNGSGKSTLVKSLTGVYVPDEGDVEVFGERLQFPVTSPHSRGIAVIHQDLGLVESMTVIENLGVSSGYGARLFGFVNEKRERARYRAIMTQMGISVPMDAQVADLSPAERSLIAVVRAIRLLEDSGRAIDRQVFILDEPTATLSGLEAERVLSLMSRMREQGAAVVFISHRLGEVTRVADRIAILRAGKLVHEGALGAIQRREIVDLMLGRTLQESFPAPYPRTSKACSLWVESATTSKLRAVDLRVHATEIVGVTGLAGMGQEDLARAVFGDIPLEGGAIHLADERIERLTPREAIARGVALVPADRHRDGCWTSGSATENLTLTALRAVTMRGLIRRADEDAHAGRMMSSFDVHPHDPALAMDGFSGGNQQKVVFAKWMQLAPKVLVLDEPTQGVDPGAAHDLLVRVVDAAREGAAVLIVSGDLEQIARVCHRVIVIDSGEIVGELTGDDLTEANILALSGGADR